MTAKTGKRLLSLFIAVLMAVTGLVPAFDAFAADGVVGICDIELFYKDTQTIVPSTDDEGNNYIEYMVEGQELELTYKLIDSEFPNSGYVKWYSETPTLVDVTQEGVVKAFDSSKGAVVQTWIDNEVKTIPLVGSIMASALEKALFNEYVDLDSMDTEEIVEIVEGAFGSDSILDQYIESYQGELIDSLRYYLDNINSNIHVQLYDSDGTLLDDDYVQICVTKNEEWYANFLPNGTHITNKSQINTTVAVGSSVQIYAVTTPLRLHYGVVYSVKSSSVFDQGKVVATVNDSGLVTFKNTGTVTIMVSPDTEEIIEGILKLVNYIYALDNTGTLDTDKIAGILIDYVGLDMNRTVLAGILDVCFAVKDIVGDTADPVQLTATAVEVISNLVLQFVYNDTITFTVVEPQPITDFDIDGPTTVREGSQIQMAITNVQPSMGDTSDITWRSSDPSIASVDPITGVITGRDAGGSLGSLSSQKCVIYAVSAANQIERSVNLTVTGKTGKYLSDVEINGRQYLEIGDEEDYTYTVYPQRVGESDNLYIKWGIQNGYDEENNPVYIWATAEEPATDGIGTIDTMGHYVVTDGGNCTIAVQATTGYYLSNGSFYEISSYIGTLEVTNGVPVESITINPTGATSNGSLTIAPTVTIDGKDYTYATIYKGVGEGYLGNGAIVSATVYPANASNQTVKWVVDNSYYENEVSEDTHTATVTQKAGHEVADTFNIYAVSEDGDVVSNVVTICVTRNNATGNVIDQDKFELSKGQQKDATHTMSFSGSWTGGAYACYKANWYSSDEGVFTVANKGNDNSDAVITAVDVGKATLYCVSADGGIVDSCEVTVYPDKTYLRNIVNICDRTVIKRTTENLSDYKDYMKKLDLAYYVLYDEDLASQTVCDTTADNLLFAFYKLGGFVGIGRVEILGQNQAQLASDFITVNVGSTTSYKKYSYDLDFKVLPADAMYSDITWTSSDSSITVDKNGVCTPASNDPCAAKITCTVTDYMGTQTSDSVYIAFSRTKATGVTLDTTSIVGGKIGETQTLTATVLPKAVLGVGGASCTQVAWMSSDESIASVDENGVVTFNKGGDCLITCMTMDGGYKADCTVNVVTNYSPLILLINQYNDLQLNSINYYPDTWETYQSALTDATAMVQQGGYSQSQVDAMYARLEAAYNGLKKYNYIQKIELYLDGEATKEFYQYDLSLLSEGISYKNAVLDLNVRIYPNNGSYESVTWESSTTDISVTNEGKCSPTINSSCYGMITCTVTDHFGNVFTDSVWVSYSYIPVTSLDLSDTNISGPVGSTYQLACTVQPTGTSLTHIGAASIQDYYWESDNTSIATVDQTGLVTFKNAGATIVRAVSYDGGISAECVVSSEGDRSALMAALELYKDVDYRDYEYSYGMEFKAAYEEAQTALTDNTLSQSAIDSAAERLSSAGAALADHPYVHVDSFNLTYSARGLTSSIGSGTVGSSDALSIKLSSSYASYSNYVEITAGALPSGSMYQSLTWSVDSTTNMDSSISSNVIKLTPTKTTDGGMAVVTITATDHYGASVSRTIKVVMSRNVCSGITVSPENLSLYCTSSPYQISSSLSGSPEFAGVEWSSSNTAVATVDQNGIVTPVEKGEAVITAKSVDGGYTATVNLSVLTDFSTLASKQNEYYNLIESVKETYEYTQESLDVLSAAVSDAKTMIDEGKATQAEVNAMIERLDNAYNSLVKYIVATGITINVVEGQSSVTVPNPGFIRYSDTQISGKSVKLNASFEPENSLYETIEWTSSSSDITVDNEGIVFNDSYSSQVSKITCTITTVKGDTYSDSVYVSFTRSAVTGISFADDLVFGAPQQTVTLSPVITNANSSSAFVIKNCAYISSNPEIASVDENGVVTFNTQGTATITATTLDGGYTATIEAFTTWDTTALKSAIDAAAGIDYMDYAYEYGTAFNTAYNNAVAVYDNIYAQQAEIDSACAALTEATANLEGNEFVTPVIDIIRNGETVADNSVQQVDDQAQVVLSKSINDGAMYKSAVWSVEDATDTAAEEDADGNLVITKTAERGSITVTLTVTDDYDREITKSVTLSIVDQIINITSIALTADGEAVTGSIVRSCGGTYTSFSGIQLGYIPTPENANSVDTVTYTSSASSYITVDSNGLLTLTTAGKLRTSNTATITCTVTNIDGTTAEASVSVTITRA
ncbi:MAG: Ig-like domain-containing protein [Eubacterium sp.]